MASLMNAQPQTIGANKQHMDLQTGNQNIDLMALLGTLIDRKYFIIAVTTIFMLVGIVFAVLSIPVYQATSMIQVENKGGTLPGLSDNMGGMFGSSSSARAEIQLLKSRSVVGEAVDSLKLDIVAKPKLFPYIGGRAFREFNPKQVNELAEISFGADSYAWGGEKINVFRFDVPSYAIGSQYILVALANNQLALQNPNGETVLTGQVGQELSNGIINLTVRELNARAGTEFTLMRRERLNTVLGLQAAIGADEQSQGSGIIDLSLQSADVNYAEKVLNKLADIYVKRNVYRNSAEAQKSLEFIEAQLPKFKKQLEHAESRFNDYQIKSQSINISIETSNVLSQVVSLETQLQQLELERLEIRRKFKKNHPTYLSFLGQVDTIKDQLTAREGEVSNLPETQQDLLRLRRDIEVSNQIYTLLLSKSQELDLVRAGIVGNVRVIDFAVVDLSRTINTKKSLIVAISTMFGGILAFAIVLVQKAMNKGIEDPAEIEAIGLTVYASVPYSDYQAKLSAFDKISKKGKVNKADKAQTILALDNPADLAIEALRSLRTSLHFAMIKAKNNVIAISGPSPGVGKSFISINLAALLAQSDKKVLVVDADMRKGYIHSELGLQWKHGLSDYLSDRLNLAQVTKTTSIAGLSVVTRGQIPPNPSELLMHSKFSQFIAEVIELYDLVIIDTPPILAVTDPAIVSAHAGTSLLVTRFGQNNLREIELTRNRFRQNDIDIRGVVFNCVVKKAGNAYGYYSYAYKSEK
jgi:tyrosine-protein kinase Etk/Wzc